MGKSVLPLAAWAFFVLQLGLGAAFIRSAAPTFDEPAHLASGYCYLATGRYRLNNMDHPPLARVWAALPLLALKPNLFLSHPDLISGRLYHYYDYFLYRNKIPASRMLNWPRAFCLLTWSALLAWALWRWALSLAGPAAAAASLAAAALCPVLVSNLALVATDGASAVLFFLTFWLLSRQPRTSGLWLASGLCAGLALAAKFNMVVIFPLALAALAWERFSRKASARPSLRGAALALGAAFFALAAAYSFTLLPLYWEGLNAISSRLQEGRSAFLMGRHSTVGFGLYFPVALAIKTPLPTLALGLGMTSFWIAKRELKEALWVLVPMLGYFMATLASKVDIGIRHLLPMMPFLVLAAGCGAGRLWGLGLRAQACVLALGVWTAASALRAGPHLLAYFNEAVGGPAQGYRYLADSNVDWGQDLKSLGSEIRAMGGPPIYLSYFGVADPAYYGLSYVPLGMSPHVDRPGDRVDPAALGRVLFAISATNLQCVYFADKTLFDWLKIRKPIKTLGYSIFLYDLTSDREGRARLARLLAASGDASRAKTLLVK